MTHLKKLFIGIITGEREEINYIGRLDTTAWKDILIYYYNITTSQEFVDRATVTMVL